MSHYVYMYISNSYLEKFLRKTLYKKDYNFPPLHNGENDSQKRQSQLWDQIICQTKTSVKLTGHTYVLQQFDKFWIFAKPELLKFGKKTSLP